MTKEYSEEEACGSFQTTRNNERVNDVTLCDAIKVISLGLHSIKVKNLHLFTNILCLSKEV